MSTRGFTIVESIVIISIIGLIAVGVGVFVTQGFNLWRITQDHVRAQESIRDAMHTMVAEIREMQISDSGSDAIESVDNNKIVFYANVDSDTRREQVTYELDGGTIYRCVVKSDGAIPPSYPDCPSENRKVIAKNIVNTDPLFRYYDHSYTGESDPLSEPIDISRVRLVQIHALVDYDPGRTPEPLEIQTNVTLRNLKDNL